MTRSSPALRLAILAALAVSPSLAAADPASVWVYTYERGTAVTNVTATIDGEPVAAPNAQGVIAARIAPGEHELVIRRGDVAVATIPIVVEDGEQLQVSVSVQAERGPVYTLRSDRHGDRTIDTAAAVAPPAGVEALPAVAETEPLAGDAAPDVASDAPEVQLEGVTVTAGAMPTDDRAAFVDEKRASADVKEALSAEEISRAGDSDAAAALKRVTGLTLVNGKYVYVRGLGERYSSVLFNGAQLPSPDPTRRVVPLDLFPTDILEGVIVQKSYSPERPAEFGGGTVQLRTKNVPDDFFFKMTLGTGWQQDTTFEDGLRYEGNGRDWTGYEDGARELPRSIRDAIAGGGTITEQSQFNPGGFTPAQIQQFGRDLANTWNVESDEIDAPVTGTLGVGDSFAFGENRFGYVAAFRYDQSWDNASEERQVLATGNEGLVVAQGYDRERTDRAIDLSAFVGVGAEFGPFHRLRANWSLLRQTTDQAQVDTGFDASPDEISQFTELEWIENALETVQVGGEHTFPSWHDLGMTWTYSRSEASRESPNTRNYRYDQQPDGRFRYSGRADNNQTVFADLGDDVAEGLVQFKLPFAFGEASTLDVYFGGSDLKRDRESEIRRFQFLSRGTIGNDPDVVFDPLEDVLSDPNIRPDGFVLRETTRATDNYTANQFQTALYTNLDVSWEGKFRATLGARHEKNEQSVTTFQIGDPDFTPIVSELDDSDTLPSATATWFIDDASQLRFAYSETLSRPDFRELSPAPFTDPVLDVESIGNPDLVQTDITNYDVRYEYYFSPNEVASVGLFYKDFENPIEKLQIPSTGNVVSFFNAKSGTDYGIELDYYRSLGFLGGDEGEVSPWESIFVALNYAWIESDVDVSGLDLALTNDSRPLQGQSPYVVNVQVGYQHPEGKRDLTLLFNRSGERIAQVGVQGVPDVYEQPANQLDFTWLERLSEEWALKLRLRNLLDPDIELTQGDQFVRRYARGREVLFTVEWTPTF
jgi:outer membrane receptor for ferrienterochelin and colicin